MMNALEYSIRNLAQRTFGLVNSHKIRKFISPLNNTENGSCGCQDNWVQIYPTFSCGLRCDYCQNLNATNKHNPKEDRSISVENWLLSLNSLGRNVCISGGDPFLYPELLKLVNGLNENIKVVICSDLSLPKSIKIANKFNRKVEFDLTYHISSGEPGAFIKKLILLRAMNRHPITVHAVAENENILKLREAQRLFRKEGFYLKLIAPYSEHNYYGARKLKRETVYCSKSSVTVGPDGKRYPCLTKAIRMVDPICDISNTQSINKKLSVLCHDYGFCVPGDLEDPEMSIRQLEHIEIKVI